MPTYTSEQTAILTEAKNTTSNLLVEARAGSGKTFILTRMLPDLRGSTVLMAFNKSIAKELETRTADLPLSTRLNLTIGTVHSMGLRAYSRAEGSKPRINGGKVSFIHKDMLKQRQSLADLFRPINYLITQIVSGAKNNGFDITGAGEPFPSAADEANWLTLMEHHNWDLELDAHKIKPEVVIEHCQKLLDFSNRQTAIVDFDDMVYLPLLRNHPLPTFNNVLVDEAQDISATRRELAFRSIAPDGRIIAVGDEYQAIYGFTGADASSLTNIGRRANATRLSLTTCFRCDALIIAEAQKQVRDIRARPSAPAGRIDRIPASTVEEALSGNLSAEKLSEAAPNLPRHGDAILCRLNKPNVSMALTLLRQGLRARIEGRDLGKRLLSHIKASESLYAYKSLSELSLSLTDFGEQQVMALEARERKSAAALLADEIDAAQLLIERTIEQGGDNFNDLEQTIADLFADDIPSSGVVTLSSVHKAKGREWPRVFILGLGDYMPFFKATQPWELQQESNLIYVAKTRAERELIYITDVASWIDKKKAQ